MKVSKWVLLFVFILGCSSVERRKDEFEKIELGMVKSEVLNVAGAPFWSDRYNGLDRWIYYMEPNTRQMEKVVYFKDGRVFQKGVREKPTLSADEMEEIKKPRVEKAETSKPYERKYSDEELKKIIKKELKEQKPKKEPKPLKKL